ncbi:uncharacterized protein LOC121969552 [Zingiber officinale]|uniref:uncharacterized protein LOC121969552 n=1 Tax=Zingiber officinale TaxID=94328 RepID=UPI001C4B645F|nr:uncharacterized protein LOC121969552 [Zingiber officinale]
MIIAKEKKKYMATCIKEIGASFGRLTMLCIRTTYRSACSHPFVFGAMFFLLALYRFSPFLFAFLFSSTPVIACTTVLLGLLLSFGEPNIPEIEEEEKNFNEMFSTEIRSPTDYVYVKDDKLIVEGLMENRNYNEEIATTEAIQCGEKANADESIYPASDGDEDLDTTTETKSLDEELKKRNFSKDKGIQVEEILGQEGSNDKDNGIEKVATGVAETDESPSYFGVTDKLASKSLKLENGEPSSQYHLEPSIGLPWLSIEDQKAPTDTDSDRSENSSPDASAADIILMLDELHPLLNSEHAQHDSNSKLDVASEASSLDEIDALSTDEEAQNHGEEEDDEAPENDDGIEAAIKWTEDDQKNVLDIGSSELERNQRLESLIAKRKAGKNQTHVMDRNLIDIDGNESFLSMNESHYGIHVPPVSAPRGNPFDSPYESEEMMGLPPIPGSAPSSLLPRRNPFDLFYDQQEQDKNLTGEIWGQQGFVSAPHRQVTFRRNETFSLGRRQRQQENRHSRLKPYFDVEKLGPEGGSSFQREFSDMSESRVSFISESDAPSNQEDSRKLDEQEFHDETEISSLAKLDPDDMDHAIQTSKEVVLADIAEKKTEHASSVPEFGGDDKLIVVNDLIAGAGEYNVAEAASHSFESDNGEGLDSIPSVNFVLENEAPEVSLSVKPFEKTTESLHSDVPQMKLKIITSSDEESDEVYPISFHTNGMDVNLPMRLDENEYSITEELPSDLRASELVFHMNGQSKDVISGSSNSLMHESGKFQVSEGKSTLTAEKPDNQPSGASYDILAEVSLQNPEHLVKKYIQSDMSFVEAKSVEDIALAFSHLSESTNNKTLGPVETIDIIEEPSYHDVREGTLDGVLVAKDAQSDMLFVEANSVEDIALAFNQLSEGTSNKAPEPIETPDNIHEPVNHEVRLDNLQGPENRIADTIQSDMSVVEATIQSDMPIVEAKSVEDIALAFRQHSESATNKTPEVETTKNIQEPISLEVGVDNLQGPQNLFTNEMQTDMFVIEAKCVEDKALALSHYSDSISDTGPEPVETSDIIQEPLNHEAGEDNLHDAENLVVKKIQSDMLVVEANSVEDMAVAFRQHLESTSNITPDNIQESINYDVRVDNLQGPGNPVVNESDMLIIEAKSVEDIALAFRQHSESTGNENLEPIEAKCNTQEPVDHEVGDINLQDPENLVANEMQSDMFIIEAKSVEDIASAFRQHSESTSNMETADNSQEPIDHEVGVDNFQVLEHLYTNEIQSDMLVIEAKSVEDIASAVRQHLDGSVEANATERELENKVLEVQLMRETGFGSQKATATKISSIIDGENTRAEIAMGRESDEVLEVQSRDEIGFALAKETSSNADDKI